LIALEKIGLKDKVKLQALGGAPETDASFRAGMIAGAVRSVKPDPKAHGLADLAELKIPFPMDLFAVNREYYKNSPKVVEGMLRAYSEGVATIKRRKPIAVEIIRKYLRKTDVEDSYEYAARYLERVPKVDPAGIQTVLAWENKSDIAPSRFYDNTIIDRLVPDLFDNIEAAALAIDDGPRPNPGSWCDRCSYRELCPASRELRYEPVEYYEDDED
jgi:ABC-type nitrate/sulfonate/bicarbonate transport system substrate-binding protein